MAASQFKGSERQAILVTADGDLYQCITPAVHWYDPARDAYYDPDRFLLKKGIEAERWGEVKTLAGCNGDSVPGVPGVGEVSAVKYLLGILPAHYKKSISIQSIEGRNIFDRNKELVKLPHPKTKSFNLTEPDYNVDAFFHFCERYGIMSYLREPKRSEWVSFFCSKKVRTRKRGSRCGDEKETDRPLKRLIV
jgi:5'-3' exonuclease